MVAQVQTAEEWTEPLSLQNFIFYNMYSTTQQIFQQLASKAFTSWEMRKQI